MPEDRPDPLDQYARHLFGTLDGAVTAVMVHLGDRLGLYRAMAETSVEGPMTSVALAAATGLQERWLREWLHNQAAAGLIEWSANGSTDSSGGEWPRFWLSPAAVAFTANPAHPAFGMGHFHHLPRELALVNRLPEAFATGLGFDYDAGGAEGAEGMERAFEPWFGAFLVPSVLPLLDGVVEKLHTGALAADVGCGAGSAVLLLARSFPASTFIGYDISAHALARARQRAAEEGVANVDFVDPRQEPLPADGSLAFVSTFDCIHDMAHPEDAAAAIRAALAPDGSWLLVDIKAGEGFVENVTRNPMASLMYGLSLLTCLPSALSEPGGAGLGTLGLSESVARRLTADAGFSRFRCLEVDHPVNAFYDVRR